MISSTCCRKREFRKPTFQEPLRFSAKNWFCSRWPYSYNTATFKPTWKPVLRWSKPPPGVTECSSVPLGLFWSASLQVETVRKRQQLSFKSYEVWRRPLEAAILESSERSVWLVACLNRCSTSGQLDEKGGTGRQTPQIVEIGKVRISLVNLKSIQAKLTVASQHNEVQIKIEKKNRQRHQ